MTELTSANLFDTSYDATLTGIKEKDYSAEEPWVKLVPRLRLSVGEDHFEEANEAAISALREATAQSVTKGGSEGKFLSDGAGLVAGPLVPNLVSLRCAALKTLRHTYLLREVGSQSLWIVSLPKSYTAWPDRYLKCTPADLVTRLSDSVEQFSDDDKKHISDAALTGLKWVLKALTALDDLKAGSAGMVLLKRWFADEDTTDDMLVSFAATLKDGLKKIAPKLGGGSIMVTDFVPIRNSAAATDQAAKKSNAFVTADKRDVIYIEPAFFNQNARNVFLDSAKHWARIMVHEMTHREVKTKDKRYGHAGIKPKKGTLPHGDAIINADSWAIFVADAAGAMEESVRTRALGGT